MTYRFLCSLVEYSEFRIQLGPRVQQFFGYITLSIIKSMTSHALIQQAIVAYDHCLCAAKQFMLVSHRNSE